MKIFFQQSGGIAGISKSVNLDTNFLPSAEVRKVQSIVKTSKFFELPLKTGQPDLRAADYFKYKITLEGDDGKKHTVETTDITKPSELGPLIEYLRGKIKEEKR